MEARMKNPANVLDGVNAGIQAMIAPIFASGLSKTVMDLVCLRVSQINTCELCIGQSMAGAADDDALSARLGQVATWRDETAFSPAECAALALAEAVTELKARYDSVPDDLWADVEVQFDERARAGLVMFISVMNMFNRINVCTRQLTPDW